MCEEKKGTVNLQINKNLLYHFEKLWIWDLDIPSHIPWEVNHGHYGLHALQLIPLVPFHCQLVLTGCTNTHSSHQSGEEQLSTQITLFKLVIYISYS